MPSPLPVRAQRAGTWAWLLLALTAALATGCAPASVLTAPAGIEPAAEIVFLDVHAAAAFLAMPGDMALIELGNTPLRRAGVQVAFYPLVLLNLLDFRAPPTNYFHVEFVRDITPEQGLRTWGFSPILRSYHPDEYRNAGTYQIMRMKDFPAASAAALRRDASAEYPRTGFCGDYVAWCFEDRIYSWWNRAPGLQRVLVNYWPPEAIHTGDHIAWSPDTTAICRVVRGARFSPELVDAQYLAAEVARGVASDHEAIRRHAAAVRARLIAAGALDETGRAKAAVVRLRVPSTP